MEADLDSFFDVAAIRSELEARRARLESEMASMQRIQEKVCLWQEMHRSAFRLTRHRSSTKSMSTCAA
jgi:hypothetical protein